MNITIKKRSPTVDEYIELRQLAEWPHLDENLIKKGLAKSLYSIVIEDSEGIILGMGRVIGDEGIYLHIQDVIVRPQFQNNGIGKKIMEELLSYVGTVSGKNTNIGLMSSKGREDFYKSFGFTERPNDRFGAGMIKIAE